MNRIKETGWDKYNDFGANYFDIIQVCNDLPDDVVVAYMTHLETLDTGLTTVKLIGKLLREKITIEGLFTVVLRTGVNESKYYFYTQNSGKDTVKSPMGMFPAYAIDNDMAYVVDKIRNYYEIGDYKTDAELAEKDSAVSGSVQKPDASGRRPRNRQAAQDGDKNFTEPLQNAASPSGSASDANTSVTAPISHSDGEHKTHDEVVAANQQKMDDYFQKQQEAIAKAAGDKDGVPWDDAVQAMDSVPAPELDKVPRRTRRERQAAQAQQEGDWQDNTDNVTVVLEKDSYFFRPSDGNYLMKHKGDSVDLVVDGKKVLEEITQEQFGAGVKAMAQGQAAPNPVEGAMNPPEPAAESGRVRRVRRTRN
jgi:hypothetical protein